MTMRMIAVAAGSGWGAVKELQEAGCGSSESGGPLVSCRADVCESGEVGGGRGRREELLDVCREG